MALTEVMSWQKLVRFESRTSFFYAEVLPAARRMLSWLLKISRHAEDALLCIPFAFNQSLDLICA